MINLKGKQCPKCKRKGLHFANHPHAFGWKDYSRIECRFCGARFKERAAEESGAGEHISQQPHAVKGEAPTLPKATSA